MIGNALGSVAGAIKVVVPLAVTIIQGILSTAQSAAAGAQIIGVAASAAFSCFLCKMKNPFFGIGNVVSAGIGAAIGFATSVVRKIPHSAASAQS